MEEIGEGKIIGVISIKGGVGKTTTVSNLGAILSSQFNKKVLLLDANFSAPNLGLHMGIVNPVHTLNDVLADNIPISQALIAHSAGFHIIPASLKNKTINPYKLRNRIMELKKNYDFILIDSSPALNEELLATIIASDELLVVTAPEYPTLSCTMKAIQTAKEKNIPISGLIINRTRNKKFELSTEEIEKSTDVPVLAVLPDDIKILESVSRTSPAAVMAPNSPAVIEYMKLAACLTGEHIRDPRFFRRMTDLFKISVPKWDVNRAMYCANLKKVKEEKKKKMDFKGVEAFK